MCCSISDINLPHVNKRGFKNLCVVLSAMLIFLINTSRNWLTARSSVCCANQFQPVIDYEIPTNSHHYAVLFFASHQSGWKWQVFTLHYWSYPYWYGWLQRPLLPQEESGRSYGFQMNTCHIFSPTIQHTKNCVKRIPDVLTRLELIPYCYPAIKTWIHCTSHFIT